MPSTLASARFNQATAALSLPLLGHLDLLRELPRVVRRAGCRTHYSRGFRPKPELALGPALSLGVASLDEYVDVSLIDPPSPDLLLERLNAAAPGGLRFTAAQRLAPKTPSISAGIIGAVTALHPQITSRRRRRLSTPAAAHTAPRRGKQARRDRTSVHTCW